MLTVRSEIGPYRRPVRALGQESADTARCVREGWRAQDPLEIRSTVLWAKGLRRQTRALGTRIGIQILDFAELLVTSNLMVAYYEYKFFC